MFSSLQAPRVRAISFNVCEIGTSVTNILYLWHIFAFIFQTYRRLLQFKFGISFFEGVQDYLQSNLFQFLQLFSVNRFGSLNTLLQSERWPGLMGPPNREASYVAQGGNCF
jgi:hypothetical protein